jgi:putative DNA primase/helicase
MKARFMRAEWFEFIPRFKLFLGTNHKPVVKGTDYGFWRRVRLIPCTVQIPEAQRDRGLGATLLTERAGILRWAVAGCLAWQREGLGEPAVVTAATASYRQESDRLGDFLACCCEVGPTATVPFATLWAAYETWTRAAQETAVGQRSFGTMLTERGYPSESGAHGTRVRRGLRLRREAPGA